MNKTLWTVALASLAVALAAPSAQAADLLVNPCRNVVTDEPILSTAIRNCSNLIEGADDQVLILVGQAVFIVDGVVAQIVATCFQDLTPVNLVANCLEYAIEQVPDVPTIDEIIEQVTAISNWVSAYSAELGAWQGATAGQTDGFVDAMGDWAGTLDDFGVAMGFYVIGEAGYYSGYGEMAFNYGVCRGINAATGQPDCGPVPAAPRLPGPEPTPEDLPPVPPYTLPPVRTDVPITLLGDE